MLWRADDDGTEIIDSIYQNGQKGLLPVCIQSFRTETFFDIK